jgi:hypothetical protein
MKQYSEKQTASLLRQKPVKESKVKIVNNMVELVVDGERVVVPTAEAYQDLLKKVMILEQRLAITDNKASRATRKKTND